MNILIIEDEKYSALRIKKIVEEINCDYHIISIIPNVKKGIEWFTNNHEPDLILSDIELGDGNCFDIFKEFQLKTPIIFLTAYKHFALHAFKLNTIGYILKPVKKEDIVNNINKFKDLIINNINNPLLETVSSPSVPNSQRFIVKKGLSHYPILASEVALFYAKSNLTYLVTKNNQNYIIDTSLENLETILDQNHFFRISRSFIIADYAIANIKKMASNRLHLQLNIDTPLEIIVSRRKVASFKAWLNLSI